MNDFPGFEVEMDKVIMVDDKHKIILLRWLLVSVESKTLISILFVAKSSLLL